MRGVGRVCATAIEPLIATPASAAQIRTLNSIARSSHSSAPPTARAKRPMRSSQRRSTPGPSSATAGGTLSSVEIASRIDCHNIDASLKGFRPAHPNPSKKGRTYRTDRALPKPDISCAILRLDDDPKILAADDAEVVGDSVAEAA